MGARDETLAAAADAAMRERGLQVRALARDLAADPEAGGAVVETWRRQIYRVLKGGSVEDPARRRLIAGRLGLNEELLAPAPPAARRIQAAAATAELEAKVARLERRIEKLLQGQESLAAQVENHSGQIATLVKAEESRAAAQTAPAPRQSGGRSG